MLSPAIGAALGALFLEYVVRDVDGHGVPEVVRAVLRRGGLLRFRMVFSRLVAAGLTIATGGSAGPEAPVAVSGAALGSNLAVELKLRSQQRIILVGAGAAAAIAAIFNAPMTGIVFTLEVILAEWTVRALIPVGIAAITATELSRMLHGNRIPFPMNNSTQRGSICWPSLDLAFFQRSWLSSSHDCCARPARPPVRS